MLNYMNNKLYKVLMPFIGLLLLVGCERVSPDGLQGSWKPVYASIHYEDGTSTYSCEGPVDEHGSILMSRVGIQHPDVKYEEPIMITGIRFFKQKGNDVFTTFFMDSPNETIGKPLMYKIENGKIYRELPKGAYINDLLDYLHEGSGEFDEGAPITFLTDGQVKIGEITFGRM